MNSSVQRPLSSWNISIKLRRISKLPYQFRKSQHVERGTQITDKTISYVAINHVSLVDEAHLRLCSYSPHTDNLPGRSLQPGEGSVPFPSAPLPSRSFRVYHQVIPRAGNISCLLYGWKVGINRLCCLSLWAETWPKPTTWGQFRATERITAVQRKQQLGKTMVFVAVWDQKQRTTTKKPPLLFFKFCGRSFEGHTKMARWQQVCLS